MDSEKSRLLRSRSSRDPIVVVVEEREGSSFVGEVGFAIAGVVVERMAEGMIDSLIEDTIEDIAMGSTAVDRAGEARRSCEPDSAAGRSQTWFCVYPVSSLAVLIV